MLHIISFVPKNTFRVSRYTTVVLLISFYRKKKTLNFTRSEESKTLHNNFNSSKTNYLCVKQFFVVAKNNFSLPCTGHINLPLPKKTPNVITLSIPRRNVREWISRIKMVLLKYSATVKTQRCLST